MPEALPNITGTFRGLVFLQGTYEYGACKTVSSSAYGAVSSTSDTYKVDAQGMFDASKSSSTYKAGAHVQPNSLAVKHWSRIA